MHPQLCFSSFKINVVSDFSDILFNVYWCSIICMKVTVLSAIDGQRVCEQLQTRNLTKSKKYLYSYQWLCVICH